MKLPILLLVFLANSIFGKPYGSYNDTICAGYDACPATDNNKVNVHLVPHSHDDVGWLETVDQYYYHYVQSVIGSVVLALKQNPERRFIQVETAFFRMWWRDQDEATRQDVIDLVNQGRLEIANGGWSSNDEAATNYQSTIDQFTLGLRYVQDNLGKCARPKAGWQVDTFGHSREQASIFSQMGLDSMYFARLDWRDKAKREADNTMDLLWTGSANLGTGSNLFTSALSNHYSAPPNFCFDIRCDDPKIVTDESSPEYNWEDRVNEFASYIGSQMEFFNTGNILIPLGDDFRWEAALESYVNYEKLMKGVEKFKPKINGKDMNVFYSTPSCHAKAVNDYVIKNNIKLDVKTDDFLPLATEPHVVWTGFITTRPNSKRFERLSNNLAQVSKQLKAIADTAQNSTVDIEMNLGILQHHDAMPGTETDLVTKDYHRGLAKGVEAAIVADNEALTKIIGDSNDMGFQSCILANMSICPSSSGDSFSVLIYNPIARTQSQYVQIPVQDGTWEVVGPDSKTIESTLTDPIANFDFVAKDLGETLLPKVLFFKAENLPPLGYNVYSLKRTSSKTKKSKPARTVKALEQIGFRDNYINFDDEGKLKSMTIKNYTIDVSQNMLYYESGDGSQAWIFRPNPDQQNALPIVDSPESTFHTSEGNLVREVKQDFGDWVTQIIRIYPDTDYIEFDYLIGPVDLRDGVGKEVISRFTTGLATKSEFYTDSNGREMIYRKRNSRPTFEYTDEEPQAGNYYPVPSKIVLTDGNKKFSILNDRGQGGSSLDDGDVELMIQRICSKDNGDLNEQAYGRGIQTRASHLITFGDVAKQQGKKSQDAIERDIALKKLLAPWIFYTSNDVSSKTQSFLNRELPENVHLLTLDKWTDDGSVLIRLEHLLELEEDIDLSKEVTVDLTDLFKSFKINSLKEYNLAANVPLDEVSRLQWPQLQKEEEGPLSIKWRLQRADDDLKITLAPMQIRSFIADVSRN